MKRLLHFDTLGVVTGSRPRLVLGVVALVGLVYRNFVATVPSELLRVESTANVGRRVDTGKLTSALPFLLALGAMSVIFVAVPWFIPGLVALIILLGSMQAIGECVARRFGGEVEVSGQSLLSLARLFFCEKFCSLVFEQTILDLRDEYREALTAYDRTGRALHWWQARVVLLGGYRSFLAAFFVQLGTSLLVWLLKPFRAI